MRTSRHRLVEAQEGIKDTPLCVSREVIGCDVGTVMWCDTDDRQDVPVIFHFVYFYGNFIFMLVYKHVC